MLIIWGKCIEYIESVVLKPRVYSLKIIRMKEWSCVRKIVDLTKWKHAKMWARILDTIIKSGRKVTMTLLKISIMSYSVSHVSKLASYIANSKSFSWKHVKNFNKMVRSQYSWTYTR